MFGASLTSAIVRLFMRSGLIRGFLNDSLPYREMSCSDTIFARTHDIRRLVIFRSVGSNKREGVEKYHIYLFYILLDYINAGLVFSIYII